MNLLHIFATVYFGLSYKVFKYRVKMIEIAIF